MRYANAQRRWLIHDHFRRTFDEGDGWPACDGSIAAGVSSGLLHRIWQNSRYSIHCSGNADPEEGPVVCVSDAAIGAMAAQHLMECKLTRFAFHGNPSRSRVARGRFEGFETALRKAGFSCTVSPIYPPNGSEKEFDKRPHWGELLEWLRGLDKPVGIMAFDDGTAMDLAAACVRDNIAVPEHVAIIGVNNDDLVCDCAWPALSSIEPGFARVGYAAAQLMERLLAGQTLRPEERYIVLPPLRVVPRQSTDILAVDDVNMADALRFIRMNACTPCSVGDVLRHVPVGRRWLERKFIHLLGRTPHEEILRNQIEAAKQLLPLQPPIPLEVVAKRCGFSSGTTFGRTFRRTVGVTPAVYRKASK